MGGGAAPGSAYLYSLNQGCQLAADSCSSRPEPAPEPSCAAGGRGVIEGLGKQLSLPDSKLEPSFASLYWYGNTSSASTWYGLSFIESVQRVRSGERVWQVSSTLTAVWLPARLSTASLR